MGLIFIITFSFFVAWWSSKIHRKCVVKGYSSRMSLFVQSTWRLAWKLTIIGGSLAIAAAMGSETDREAASVMLFCATVTLIFIAVSAACNSILSARVPMPEMPGAETKQGPISSNSWLTEPVLTLEDYLADGWSVAFETDKGWQLRKRPPYSIITKILFWVGVVTLILNGLGLVFILIAALNHYLIGNYVYAFSPKIKQSAVDVSRP